MSLVREQAILPFTPAADQSAYEGYFVNVSGDTATVSASASTSPFGVILDGETTSGKSSVAVCGGNVGTVRVKLGGTVTKGQYMQLHSDGRAIVDAGSGARILVALCLESGVANDLVEAMLLTPVTYSA
jgi:hypothetical protein